MKGLHSEFEGAGTPFFPGFLVSEFSDSRQQLAYEAPESSIYAGSGVFLWKNFWLHVVTLLKRDCLHNEVFFIIILDIIIVIIFLRRVDGGMPHLGSNERIFQMAVDLKGLICFMGQ